MRVGVGGAWIVFDTGKGGLQEKRLGTTGLEECFAVKLQTCFVDHETRE